MVAQARTLTFRAAGVIGAQAAMLGQELWRLLQLFRETVDRQDAALARLTRELAEARYLSQVQERGHRRQIEDLLANEQVRRRELKRTINLQAQQLVALKRKVKDMEAHNDWDD